MTIIKNKEVIYMPFIIFIYIFSSLTSYYVLCYEYIFTDKNKTKEYVITSDRSTFYAYIPLAQDMYTVESQGYDFRIREAYENNDYFFGLDYNYEEKTNKIVNKSYIVVDKITATMKIYSEKEFKKKFKGIEFVEIHFFLKTRGTKVGWNVNLI